MVTWVGVDICSMFQIFSEADMEVDFVVTYHDYCDPKIQWRCES